MGEAFDDFENEAISTLAEEDVENSYRAKHPNTWQIRKGLKIAARHAEGTGCDIELKEANDALAALSRLEAERRAVLSRKLPMAMLAKAWNDSLDYAEKTISVEARNKRLADFAADYGFEVEA